MIRLHRKGYDLGDYVNGKPTSFGPFQVHFARDHKAIGDQMLAAGIDARDPKTIPAQAKWIADYLKSHPHLNIGGVWHGYDRGRAQIAAGKGSFGGGGYEGGAGRSEDAANAVKDAARRANPRTLGAPSTVVPNMAGAGNDDGPSPRANFMHGQFGRPGENIETIGAAGRKVSVNKAAAPYFKGFPDDLAAAGAPITSLGGYNYLLDLVSTRMGTRSTSTNMAATAATLSAAAFRNGLTPTGIRSISSNANTTWLAVRIGAILIPDTLSGAARRTLPRT